LKALLSCSGVTGVAARDLVKRLHDVVSISWHDALDVYSSHDLPRYTRCAGHISPGYDGLSPQGRAVHAGLEPRRVVRSAASALRRDVRHQGLDQARRTDQPAMKLETQILIDTGAGYRGDRHHRAGMGCGCAGVGLLSGV
jgi:hypothetical protein